MSIVGPDGLTAQDRAGILQNHAAEYQAEGSGNFSNTTPQQNADILQRHAAEYKADAAAQQGEDGPPAPKAGGSLNNPDQTGIVRFPRLRVMVGKDAIPGAIEFNVTNNNHFQADRFTATFALSGSQKWWGAQDTILMDLQASLDAGRSWVSLLIGEADGVSLDMIGGTVRVEGRDLTSRLIEAKTQETFLNQTSSQIATTLASRHGMTAEVTPTSTPVGRFYTADHDHITKNEFSRTTTEWDLLCFLAQQEGFDVWVTGTVLHFHPATKPDATPWVVRWQPGQNGGPSRCNATRLTPDRRLVLARDIVVEVHSWSSRKGSRFTKTAPVGAGAGKVRSGKAQRISVTRPNLTPDAAQKLANQILTDASKQERLIEWSEPGDLALTARSMVRLEGTGSSWDQVYFIDSITRTMHFEQGFTMDVHAKNHSTESDPSAL